MSNVEQLDKHRNAEDAAALKAAWARVVADHKRLHAVAKDIERAREERTALKLRMAQTLRWLKDRLPAGKTWESWLAEEAPGIERSYANELIGIARSPDQLKAEQAQRAAAAKRQQDSRAARRDNDSVTAAASPVADITDGAEAEALDGLRQIKERAARGAANISAVLGRDYTAPQPQDDARIEIAALKAEIAALKAEIAALKAEIAALKAQVADAKRQQDSRAARPVGDIAHRAIFAAIAVLKVVAYDDLLTLYGAVGEEMMDREREAPERDDDTVDETTAPAAFAEASGASKGWMAGDNDEDAAAADMAAERATDATAARFEAMREVVRTAQKRPT